MQRSNGCANGSYYMNLAVVGPVKDPDPVIDLSRRYGKWREAQSGRPDQVNSTWCRTRSRSSRTDSTRRS